MRIKSFRFDFHELAGALGDLGVLLPLAISLITINHMNPTSVFAVVGLAYIASGLFYRLPMPVQPLKAVAAIAIAEGLSPGVISASGLLMALVLLILALTRASAYLSRLFPKAVIRGIQLGVGLILLKTGLLLTMNKQVIAGGANHVTNFVNFNIPTGLLIGMALGIVFVICLFYKRLPASLAVIALGVPAGIFWGPIQTLPGLHLGLNLPPVAMPTLAELYPALVLLVIPQIPLTLGNAVYATADTAEVYFGQQAKKVTPRALLTSMGIFNLGAGLLGGMPICHGSGGLTAHFRLGARTGGAALMIGVPLLLMAVFLDGNLLPILALVPYAVLGILVIFAGIQHSLLVRDITFKKDILVVMAVAIPGFLTSNLAIGLASGICLYLILNSVSKNYSPWFPQP